MAYLDDGHIKLVEAGTITVKHGDTIYSLLKNTKYSVLHTKTLATSAHRTEDLQAQRRWRKWSMIGVVGNKMCEHDHGSVDPTSLFTSYGEAIAATVSARRSSDGKGRVGIVMYFPQSYKHRPSYMVTTHHDGGLWENPKHCVVERISTNLVMYQTHSDIGILKANQHIDGQFGPIIIGHTEAFRCPGRLSDALVAISGHSPITASEMRDFITSFTEASMESVDPQVTRCVHESSCIRCGATRARKKCGECMSRYCSRTCQKLHWKEHKRLCKKVASARGLELSDRSGTFGQTMRGMHRNRMDNIMHDMYLSGVRNTYGDMIADRMAKHGSL